MKTIPDIRYSDAAACKLDLYLPDCSQFPVMVFFHGGGLEGGDKRDDGDVCAILAQNGVAVASVNYRMYPDAGYPDFIVDAASAVQWVYSHIGSYGVAKAFFIAGSSAGAYLSMMLCFDRKYLAAHGIDPDGITGYIFNSAQPTTHFNVLRERGMDPRSVVADEAAPIYHIAENPAAAPMLILVSDHDIPNRLEQTNLFYSTLKLFGIGGNKVDLRLMEGYEHCGYDHAVDGNGNSIFAGLILGFIRGTTDTNRNKQ